MRAAVGLKAWWCGGACELSVAVPYCFSLCTHCGLFVRLFHFCLNLSLLTTHSCTHIRPHTYTQVPYTTTVKLKRPIGLHVVEGPGHTVFVQSVKADLSAARSRRVEVGDQIVAMSASWGDRMWEVNSVESFVVVRWSSMGDGLLLLLMC